MKKWIGRILEGLDRVIFAFMVMSILSKLLFKEDDWLLKSLTLSIPYLFIVPISYYALIDRQYKKWQVVIFATILVFICSLFVLGVCLSVDDYWYKTFMITFFVALDTMAVKVNKARDEKRSSKKQEKPIEVDIIV
jgi:positive regulator of sigma E activity